ncbi:MAG: hypothetical protein WD598_16140 [Acidimicrobiia bacterium]
MTEEHARPRLSSSVAETIVVGVVLDGTTVPAWVYSVLSRLERDPAFDWGLTLLVGDARRARRGRTRALGFRAFEALDARRHASRANDALAARDATALVAGRPRIEVSDDRDLAPPLLAPTAPRGAARRFDVVLDLRATRGPSPTTDFARYGVWWAEPASDHPRPGDAVFWAIHDRQSTCDVQLVTRVAGTPDPVVAATATVGLQPASLAVSRSLCYWKAATLVLQQLAGLRVGDGNNDVAAANRGPTERRPVSARPPRAGAVARVAGRQLKAAIGHRIAARRTREQWLLGIRLRMTDTPTLDGLGFRAIVPPPDRTFADPFLLDHGSTTHLFLEEFEFARGRGVISVTTVGDDGQSGVPEVVLERPYHLSYPFVFRDGADVFMIPESAANRTVELYRAVDFPRGWELHDVILEDVRALDSSLLHHGGRYWLFTSIEEPGRNRNDELHLFTSAALEGPWTPHSRNPVVTDVRRARPAGRPFLMDGSLIRPAQDCSVRYGFSVAFQRVDILTDDDYAEETIAVLGPTWSHDLEATHTFNTLGRIDVVDGLRRIPLA